MQAAPRKTPRASASAAAERIAALIAGEERAAPPVGVEGGAASTDQDGDALLERRGKRVKRGEQRMEGMGGGGGGGGQAGGMGGMDDLEDILKGMGGGGGGGGGGGAPRKPQRDQPAAPAEAAAGCSGHVQVRAALGDLATRLAGARRLLLRGAGAIEVAQKLHALVDALARLRESAAWLAADGLEDLLEKAVDVQAQSLQGGGESGGEPAAPRAPATSPSGLDTPRQRHESQRRAASRLGQPRPAGWWAFWLAGRPQRPCLPRIVCIHRWEGEREGDAAQRDGVRRRLLRAAVHGPHHAQPHRAARAAQPRHNGPASYATGGSNPGPAAVGPAGPRQGPWQGPRQGPKAGLLRTRASLPLCRQPCRVLPQQPPRGMGRQAAGRRARRAARSDLARPRGHGGRRPRELHRAPTPTLAGALAEPTRPAH